ncbi:serine protease 48 [Sarcoptes scabiei]|nr:serine protease 48 [Sarcoptes scabiei]
MFEHRNSEWKFSKNEKNGDKDHNHFYEDIRSKRSSASKVKTNKSASTKLWCRCFRDKLPSLKI